MTSDYPLAYLLTFHTHGTWLHGASRGSVDRLHNGYETELAAADPHRETVMRARMRGKPFTLSRVQRQSIGRTMTELCEFRGWNALAINVRTNHVHLVVEAAAAPEKVMNDCKAWATRRLREADLVAKDTKVWSRHGSTRYLWKQESVDHACTYVLEGQGVDLD